jgi:predicted P-loop ATPase
LAKEQEDRYQADAWEDILGAFVRGKRAVETTLLFSHGLEIEMGRITRADQTRLGICMRRLGWVRHRTRVNGTLVYQYVCQDPALANKNK